MPSATCGTITVEPEPEPDFSIMCAGGVDGEVTVGESTSVGFELSNDGDASGTATVALTVDGSAEETTSVSLDGGQTTTGSFDVVFDDTGDYTLGVELV